jgi:hypothetical protein
MAVCIGLRVQTTGFVAPRGLYVALFSSGKTTDTIDAGVRYTDIVYVYWF